MIRLLIGIIAIAVAVFIAFAVLCAMIAGKHCDKEDNTRKTTKTADENLPKSICSQCKTGQASYELDKHSEVCPYISCCKNNKCAYYVPLE